MNQMKLDGNDFILLNQLIHVTQLNLSHNHRIHALDLRLLNNLESFHCSYNNTIRLILNGHSLKQLNASHNSKKILGKAFVLANRIFVELKQIDVVNTPINLIQLDIS